MSDIRGIGDFSSQIEARGRAALNATDVKYKAKEKTDEIIKAVGEGKSYLSGKGLSEKLIGNIKKKAAAKLKSLGKDAKAKLEKEGQKAYNTVKEKVSGKIEEAKSAIKGKVEGKLEEAKGAVQEAKGAVEDKLASASEKAEAAVQDKIGSTTEELASKFPSIGAPLEGEEAVEGTALKTGQAASRGEQFAQEIKTGETIGQDARAGLQDAKGTIRIAKKTTKIAKKATKIAKKGQKLAKEQRAADQPEPKPPSGPPPKGQPSTLEEANQAWKESQEAAEQTSDISLTGEEDSMRVGQTAGQAAQKQVEREVEEKTETEVETQVEEKAETLAPKLETLAPKAETLASKLEPTLAKVGKAAAKGAEEGGEVVAEGGGPEDPITDAIGLVIGIGTTIYGLAKKPHTPLAPPPATESSVSYQAGI